MSRQLNEEGTTTTKNRSNDGVAKLRRNGGVHIGKGRCAQPRREGTTNQERKERWARPKGEGTNNSQKQKELPTTIKNGRDSEKQPGWEGIHGFQIGEWVWVWK